MTIDLYSSRAQTYAKLRPGYDRKIVDFVVDSCHINKKHEFNIVDIGAGTGLLSRAFIDEGFSPYLVEPVIDMLNEAKKANQHVLNPNHFIYGNSVNTKLDNNFADLIIVGQAFHWFPLRKTVKEFVRILKDPNYLLLTWNVMQPFDDEKKAFEYKKLLNKHCTSQTEKESYSIEENLSTVFANYQKMTYQFEISFEKQAFIALHESFSGMPKLKTKEGELLATDMHCFYKKFHIKKTISVKYCNYSYLGELNGILVCQ